MSDAQVDWFKDWFDSKYYHVLYDHRDEAEAQAFLDRMIVHLDVKEGRKVLDLACGKGRHARHLAGLGLNVHGVDLSEESIRYCKQFERRGLTFEVHDMRELYLENEFDLILNLFTSFGYFDAESENERMLNSIRRSLRPKGRFLIDFLNVTPVLAKLPKTESISKKGIVFDVEKYHENARIYKQISFEADGRSHQFTEQVQALNLEDFERMIKDTGLQVDEVFGSYFLDPFDIETSDRLIITGSVA